MEDIYARNGTLAGVPALSSSRLGHFPAYNLWAYRLGSPRISKKKKKKKKKYIYLYI
ncbi:hypothetical protein YC2023_050321 [Brassica napus]